MQSVDLKQLEAITGDFENVLREIPGARREMHERVGAAVLSSVRAEIDASGINDASGHIKRYQEDYVGTGGGYAAVRAVKGQGPNGAADSPGAITNYLAKGHSIRRPTGNAAVRRKSRARKQYVDGYHFYDAARRDAERVAYSEAERYAKTIAGKLSD